MCFPLITFPTKIIWISGNIFKYKRVLKFNKAKEPIIMIDSFYEDKYYVYAINPIIKYPIVAIAAHASA